MHGLVYFLYFRFVILLEEWVSPNQCTITAHNLLHIKDDIKRFGHPDNYWCWFFERCVKKYIKISQNHKNIECSFANAESRREVLKFHNEVVKKKNVAHLDNEEEVSFNQPSLNGLVFSN